MFAPAVAHDFALDYHGFTPTTANEPTNEPKKAMVNTWREYLLAICHYYWLENAINVYVVKDGRCREGIRLLFGENPEVTRCGHVVLTKDIGAWWTHLEHMRRNHPKVRYVIDKDRHEAEENIGQLVEV